MSSKQGIVQMKAECPIWKVVGAQVASIKQQCKVVEAATHNMAQNTPQHGKVEHKI